MEWVNIGRLWRVIWRAVSKATVGNIPKLKAEYFDVLCQLAAELVAWLQAFNEADNLNEVSQEIFDTLYDWGSAVDLPLAELLKKSKKFYAQNTLVY